MSPSSPNTPVPIGDQSPGNGPAGWWREHPGAVTVCDPDGIILAMNDRAAEVFAADGGRSLVGQNVLACHPEPSRSKLRTMLAEGRANVYTIEKRGVKKLIHQAPWKEDGIYRGFVELALEIPVEMPHFIRSAGDAS